VTGRARKPRTLVRGVVTLRAFYGKIVSTEALQFLPIAAMDRVTGKGLRPELRAATRRLSSLPSRYRTSFFRAHSGDGDDSPD
jgi:hypothetical protein